MYFELACCHSWLTSDTHLCLMLEKYTARFQNSQNLQPTVLEGFVLHLGSFNVTCAIYIVSAFIMSAQLMGAQSEVSSSGRRIKRLYPTAVCTYVLMYLHEQLTSCICFVNCTIHCCSNPINRTVFPWFSGTTVMR